jgi:ribosomal protein L37AE/L43A
MTTSEENAAVCDECNKPVKYTRIKSACGIWIFSKCVLLIEHTHWDILTEYHKQKEE